MLLDLEVIMTINKAYHAKGKKGTEPKNNAIAPGRS
jgi:hypothetical protein